MPDGFLFYWKNRQKWRFFYFASLAMGKVSPRCPYIILLIGSFLHNTINHNSKALSFSNVSRMNPGNHISPVISIDNKLKAPVSRLLQNPEYDYSSSYSKKNADNSILKKVRHITEITQWIKK